MKMIALFLISSLALSAAFAQTPVQDEKVLETIRQRYNGTWIGDMAGQIGGEVLKDTTVLVEASDRLAEFAFYNLPLGQEDTLYIPRVGPAGYMNYFVRSGNSLACSLSSYDLKNEPFPTFKCRFSVDADGNVKAFVDRSAANSNSKPSGWDGQWWDGGLDLMIGKVDAMTTSANAYSHFGVRKGPDVVKGAASFHFQFGGPLGLAIYNQLNAPMKPGSWGPTAPYMIKFGKQIWCLKLDKSTDSAKCRVNFTFDGDAITPTETEY